MDDCIFCKIVKGEIPAKKVHDDKDVIAFLDINPANPGHTLVATKKHVEDITKSDELEIDRALNVAKKIATKMKENLGAEGINVIQNNGKAAGQLVPHLHFHVIPRYPGDMVVISYQRANVSESEMEEIRKKLSGETPAKKEFDFDF